MQFQVLTIGDVIESYGTLPRQVKQNEFGRYFKIPNTHSFVEFATKLRKLGLTSSDWPLLAQTLRGLYKALLDQVRNDKEKIRTIPALALEIPPTISAALERHLGKCRIDITVGDLLQIRPSELQRFSSRRKIGKSIADTREILLSLGFTSDDGTFLFENSFQEVISKISSDLGVDSNDAERFFQYFHAHFQVENRTKEKSSKKPATS